MSVPVIYFLFGMASFGLFPVDKLIHWGFLNPVDTVLKREAYNEKKKLKFLDPERERPFVPKHTGFAFSQEAGHAP